MATVQGTANGKPTSERSQGGRGAPDACKSCTTLRPRPGGPAVGCRWNLEFLAHRRPIRERKGGEEEGVGEERRPSGQCLRDKRSS